MAAPTIELDPAAPVPDRAAAAAYVASVCFKHGPPRLVGAELEWLVRSAAHPSDPLDPTVLLRALGPHAPQTLRRSVPPGPLADPPAAPETLPAGGVVTVEPGGQVEIATPPLPSLSALVAAIDRDADELGRRLGTEDLVLGGRASDPLRPPRRLLHVPRYAAMEAAFDRVGPHGRTMMCSTAAVQVCLDAGDGPAVADRWRALHELGPTLLATFANSPTVHGRRTGWKSSRMASWHSLDPERTDPPVALGDDPAEEYAHRALDTSLMCVRRDDGPWGAAPAVTFGEWVDGVNGGADLGARPTLDDLDFHLTTIFPPVRPQGHLEVRYLDQQPAGEWAVPIAVVAALLDDPAVLDAARAAAAPTAGRWHDAARLGLDDPDLARSAAEVVGLAERRLTTLDPDLAALVGDVAERRVLRGRCPADVAVGAPDDLAADPDLPGGDRSR